MLAYAGGWKQWLKDNELEERFEFNRNLMDFDRIPEEIKKRVTRDYDNYEKPDLDKILGFFQKYKWPEYMENFTNVENKIMSVY